MRTAIICVVLLAAAISTLEGLRHRRGLKIDTELDPHWESFKLHYGKSYESTHEIIRRSIWEENLRTIQNHNLEFDMGLHTYTMGMNHFGDLTHEEFRFQYLRSPMPSAHNSTLHLAPLNIGALPDSVDWRTSGYVTEIKDQGQCGSCWAFSTTGSLEGQYFRKTGQLVSLSEQQLVDCSRSFGNQGCNGGLMDLGFKYIKSYGIEHETDYPYTARDGSCKYDTTRIVTKVSGFVDIKAGSEADLQNAVATVGPVSVAIDASRSSFQFYKSGVYSEPRCSPTNLDHGVLAVGYGTENGKDYWLVKNSWGTVWGDKGYIKMSRNAKNQCGIATASSYPLL